MTNNSVHVCLALDQATGLIRTSPYMYNYIAQCKPRWANRKLIDVFMDEFGTTHPSDYIPEAFQEGAIQVNGDRVDQSYICKQGDRIQHRMLRFEPPIQAQLPQIIADYSNSLGIIAVNKPSSIPIHACGAYNRLTLISLLQSGWFTRTESYSEDKDSPSAITPSATKLSNDSNFSTLKIVHRLDRLTSGLVLFATNKRVANNIAQQIQKGHVRKMYLAKVRMNSSVDPWIPKIHPALKSIVRWTHISPCHGASTTHRNCDGACSKPCHGTGNAETKISMLSKASVSCTCATIIDALSRIHISKIDAYSILDKLYDIEMHCIKLISKMQTNSIMSSSRTDAQQEIVSTTSPAASPSNASMSYSTQLSDWLVVNAPLVTIEPKRGIVGIALKDSEKQKASITLVRRIAKSTKCQDNETILVCVPITGRTHQIRVHLQAIGFPIINDPFYSTPLYNLGASVCDPSKNLLDTILCNIQHSNQTISDATSLPENDAIQHSNQTISGATSLLKNDDIKTSSSQDISNYTWKYTENPFWKPKTIAGLTETSLDKEKKKENSIVIPDRITHTCVDRSNGDSKLMLYENSIPSNVSSNHDQILSDIWLKYRGGATNEGDRNDFNAMQLECMGIYLHAWCYESLKKETSSNSILDTETDKEPSTKRTRTGVNVTPSEWSFVTPLPQWI